MGKGMDGSTGFKVPDANECSTVYSFLLWRNSTTMCSKLGAYHKAIKGNLTITKVGDFPSNSSGGIWIHYNFS